MLKLVELMEMHFAEDKNDIDRIQANAVGDAQNDSISKSKIIALLNNDIQIAEKHMSGVSADDIASKSHVAKDYERRATVLSTLNYCKEIIEHM